MADQANTALEREYAAITTYVRRHVLLDYELEILRELAPGYPREPERWREVWQVPVSVSTGEAKIFLAIPKTFPDVLPVVYLPEDVKGPGSERTIPHLSESRILCTFDPAEARINADAALGVTLDVIERARRLLDEGVAGTNLRDYADEFGAYWEQGATSQSLSLVNPTGNFRTVSCLRLTPNWKKWTYLFAENAKSGRRWLEAAGYQHKPAAEDALYLPLKDLGLPPYPATNGDIYERLKNLDREALAPLLKFLERAGRPAAVLFSVPAGENGRALGAWWHPVYVHQVYTIRKGRERNDRFKNVAPGFRRGGLPASVELWTRNRAGKLSRSVVERADRERLVVRTAGVASDIFRHPVNVIGCGALGSVAAAFLAQTGATESLRLIDPERLQIENVARHYCGMSEVGEQKTVATARKIERHFPHVECVTREESILEVLRASPDWLSPAALNLVTIGSLAVERRLNRLAMTAAADEVPYCYLWVEPHLYGGHALFVRGGRGGCFDCAFDEGFQFRHRVVADGGRFSIREAGCRSGYMPYSGLQAAEFVAATIRFTLEAVSGSENQVFSWAGDLEAARRDGVTLAPEWDGLAPFTSRVRRLEADTSCPVCSACTAVTT